MSRSARPKAAVDIELPLGVGQRAAEGPLDEPPAELPRLRVVSQRFFGHARLSAEAGRHAAGDFDRGVGDGLLPLLGNRRPALVAGAAVVGRQRRLQHEHFGHVGRQEAARGDDLLGGQRRLPFQRHAGRLVLPFHVIDVDRIGPPAEQADRRAMVTLAAGADPGVDERAVLVVEEEAAAAGGVQIEVVVARLRREKRAAPMDLVLFRGDLALQRPFRAEIEIDARVDLLHGRIVVDLVLDAVPRRIECPQAARGVVRRGAVGVADQVRNEVHVLVHRHPCEFHARRLVACAGCGRIERVKDIRRHVLRIVADARARIVFRHRLGDEGGELILRFVSGQGMGIVIDGPLSRRAVARWRTAGCRFPRRCGL